jgi:hypothetical protein
MFQKAAVTKCVRCDAMGMKSDGRLEDATREVPALRYSP